MVDAAHPGLYVHVPFCLSKCAYCDFYSITDGGLIPHWLAALEKEAGVYQDRFGPFDTLYIGGGTPSLLDMAQITALIEGLRQHFSFSPDTEVTLEANPDDLTPEKITLYQDLGVNRLSLGVQSFDDQELAFLGRRHNARQTVEALEAIRAAGFSNLSLDLIYGLPGQSLEDWRNTLEQALSFQPEHLSCYQLTYEAKTPLGRRRARGEVAPATEEEEREFFLFTSRFLAEHGYLHYEISSFARLGEPGKEPDYHIIIGAGESLTHPVPPPHGADHYPQVFQPVAQPFQAAPKNCAGWKACATKGSLNQLLPDWWVMASHGGRGLGGGGRLGQAPVINPKDATPTLTLPPQGGGNSAVASLPHNAPFLANEEFCPGLINNQESFNRKPKTENRKRYYYSRHNRKYWRHVPYLGLGPGAHSFQDGVRWWNASSVGQYCQSLAQERAPVADREVLSPEQFRLEALYLGLRTKDGVPLDLIRRTPGWGNTLTELIKSGLIEVNQDRVVPTLAGFLLADCLPLWFMDGDIGEENMDDQRGNSCLPGPWPLTPDPSPNSLQGDNGQDT
jgi:coproporphyrinogen III oxidase-like Fe-S oxidoreductase